MTETQTPYQPEPADEPGEERPPFILEPVEWAHNVVECDYCGAPIPAHRIALFGRREGDDEDSDGDDRMRSLVWHIDCALLLRATITAALDAALPLPEHLQPEALPPQPADPWTLLTDVSAATGLSAPDLASLDRAAFVERLDCAHDYRDARGAAHRRAWVAMKLIAQLGVVYGEDATVGETVERAGINVADYPASFELFSDMDVQRLRRAVQAAIAQRTDA